MTITLDNNANPWFYFVKKSDEIFNGEVFNLEGFSKKFNFNISDFERLNGKIKSISFGDILIIPPSSKYVHIVKPTETIEKIAKIYGLKADELKIKNKISQIFIGQKIFI